MSCVMDLNTYLSPHFKLSEFLVSRDYPKIADGLPSMIRLPHALALKWLCMTLLEPARSHFDVPFIVQSGWRSARLNELVGGSKTSQHRVGEAADITVPDVPHEDVCGWIVTNCEYGFGQLRLYENRNFFHISLPSIHHRGQFTEIE